MRAQCKAGGLAISRGFSFIEALPGSLQDSIHLLTAICLVHIELPLPEA
jgi:hypothetical protein